jgi:MFS family permease
LLLTLAGIQFAHILDFMIMMPLGPILMRELGVGTHEFGLLVSAYTFSAAFTGVLAAMFVDRFERKRLLLTMFALFAVATLACGLAPGYWSLLIARGTAGAFGGVLGSMVQTMVGDLIPFERRRRATFALPRQPLWLALSLCLHCRARLRPAPARLENAAGAARASARRGRQRDRARPSAGCDGGRAE